MCERTLQGHSDFIKSLTILPGPALLSTSSDRTARLWDLRPLADGSDPECVQILRQHTRPVECAAYRTATPDMPGCIVWTADSLGAIKQWTYDEKKLSLALDKELRSHETSVSQLRACHAGVWSGKCRDSHDLLITSVHGQQRDVTPTRRQAWRSDYREHLHPVYSADGTRRRGGASAIDGFRR
jgi:WD40 repeat protein